MMGDVKFQLHIGRWFYYLNTSNLKTTTKLLTLSSHKLVSPKEFCGCPYWTYVATLLWQSVGVKPNTPKVGDLESSETLECSELNSKAQNTSHWNVLGVIGKVLKRRYRKWPRIGHSDIRSPSYGQKKGRESNWQFDSRPLKVGNRPLPDVRIESATRRRKDLNEGYNFGSDLVAIGLHSQELWPFKVPGVQPRQFWDSISGVPTKCAIWM
jgi:hypothetical protein